MVTFAVFGAAVLANYLVLTNHHKFDIYLVLGFFFFGFCAWWGIYQAVTPRFFYNKEGFLKKKDQKVIKWKQVVQVSYLKAVDQVSIVTPNKNVVVLSSNITRDFEKVLSEIVSLIRKHNSNIEIPIALLERFKTAQ
jgi:hypothetical protein